MISVNQQACPNLTAAALNTDRDLIGPITVESFVPQLLLCANGFTPRGLSWERFTCNFNTGTWMPDPTNYQPYCNGIFKFYT